MEKVLTVSIAAYNAEKDLECCLNSLLQTSVAEKLEIIVVNDGSKDNTAALTQEYVDNYPHIVRLINKENGGHGSTINTSIQTATAKYYKVVDSDDWVDQQGLEHLVKILSSTEADMVVNPYFGISADTRTVNAFYQPFATAQPIGVVQSIEQVKSLKLAMHAITFNTRVVKEMGPIISENCFYVDAEYTILSTRYIQSILCLDFPVYCYLLGTATQSMNMNNQIKRRNQHLHVTKRIINYYTENKNKLHPNIRDIVLEQIQGIALSQYKIYFNMPAREAKPEILEFENWLKTHAPEVYCADDNRFSRILNFNRKTQFYFLSLSIPFLNLLHLVLKYLRKMNFAKH